MPDTVITQTTPLKEIVASPRTRWPNPNLDSIKAITKDGPKLVDLWDASPVQRVSDTPNTEVILDLLYPDNPWLCIGKTQKYFDTLTLDYWRGRLLDKQFIVPSPMTGQLGITTMGKRSKHTLNNTGPRRYLVLDFDNGTLDQHAAIIWHLGKYAPLTMVLFSGGKGLHAWFNVHKCHEPDVLKFFQYSVSLWADKRLWTRSQFARLPDGLRSGDKQKPEARQPVIYINPENIAHQ